MKYLSVFILIGFSSLVFGQIPKAGELLGMHNLSTSEMNSINSPNLGSLIYNTTENELFIFNGSLWKGIKGWKLSGNKGTNPNVDFLGTTDDQDLILKSNNTERLRLDGNKGQVLVNQANTFNNHPLVIRAKGVDILAFEDESGTPKWHWNILSDGLNFVESNVADYRLFIKNGGNVGIGTHNPEATLEIESNAVPFKIEPSTSTPAGSSGGQMFISSDDGILYIYDGTRNKWLSVDRTMIGWGINNNNATYRYLKQFNGADSDKNGWRMIRNGTITSITAQTDSDNTWVLEIRKNDSVTPIATLNINNTTGNHNTALDIDFDEGDYLQAYCNGEDVNRPETLIEIAWRK